MLINQFSFETCLSATVPMVSPVTPMECAFQNTNALNQFQNVRRKVFHWKYHKLWRISNNLWLIIYLWSMSHWQWLIIKRVNTILNVSSAQNQVAMRKWSAQKIQTKMLLQLNVEKEQVSNAKISDTDRFKNEMYLSAEKLSVTTWIIFWACILKLDKRAPMEWISWSKRIHFPLWLWWPKHNCPYGRNAQLRPLR